VRERERERERERSREGLRALPITCKGALGARISAHVEGSRLVTSAYVVVVAVVVVVICVFTYSYLSAPARPLIARIDFDQLALVRVIGRVGGRADSSRFVRARVVVGGADD